MLVLAQDFGAGGGAAAPAGAPAAAPASGSLPGGGGGYEQILFIVLMFVVFYFLLIRPQQKQRKKHQELVKNLKRGDTVITNSGMFGEIVAMDETSVTLEIAKNTRVKMLKSYVGGLANAETEKKLAENPPAV